MPRRKRSEWAPILTQLKVQNALLSVLVGRPLPGIDTDYERQMAELTTLAKAQVLAMLGRPDAARALLNPTQGPDHAE